METMTHYARRNALLADTAYLGGDVYVMWDGSALHLRETAGDPLETDGPGDWITLETHMVHALMLFCESRRIP
jgi:hypothetical protein